jgi:tyrosinase
MRTTFLSATLAVSGVSALPQKFPGLSNILPDATAFVEDVTSSVPAMIENILAPALDLSQFMTPKFTNKFTLEDILNRKFETNDTEAADPDQFRDDDSSSISATCSNVRTRIEWDSYSNSDRQAYINGIKCLQSRPASGQFSQSRSRYEDLVSLHQNLTPNVHGNAKFLLWHRYYLWMFEDILRSECGFDRALPWWDETKVAGRFASSSIFSDQWYGGISKSTRTGCAEDMC